MTPTLFNASDLIIALPELFLAGVAMILLVYGALAAKKQGPRITTVILWLAVAALFIAAMMLTGLPWTGRTSFEGGFILDGFAGFAKILILLGLAASLMLAKQYLIQIQTQRFEYPVLVMLAGIGMMIMVSANDLLTLYMGLELQSLSLYVLAAIRRDHAKSAESGMKYFVLGAISSGMLLFGASLVYGYTGALGFWPIGTALAGLPQLGPAIGMVFVLAGLAFKISAVPFHMWTPDVYEGAPTSVTALFAIVPKIAAICLLVRVISVPFAAMQPQWMPIIWGMALASMLVGALAGLAQDNIKRLMAYSSIGNMGYALIGVVAAGEKGIAAVLVYMAIYMVMTIGTFAIILFMRRDGRATEQISDLAGLSRHAPLMAYSLAALMFSMSGIPPLAGFFGKLMIFQAAVAKGYIVLAVLGIITSVIAAYYYLRIIKVMFFDEPADGFEKAITNSRRIVLGASMIFVILFILHPSPLISAAQAAAASLFTISG